MNINDRVEKVGGDYTFVGKIVSKFQKISGAIRYVVEDDRGVLHIYSEKNLKLLIDRSDDIDEDEWMGGWDCPSY